MNFYKKRNKKSNLTKHELAVKLNTDVEKIEQLENRELEIGGETFKKYVDTTNMSKAEIDLEYAKLLEWYNKTDIKKLRKEFGYNTQLEFAKKCGIPQSVYCMVENKNIKRPTYATLMKVYEFYNNDFNKQVTKKIEVEDDDKDIEKFIIKKVSPIVLTTTKIWELNWEEIINNVGCTQRSFSLRLGLDPSILSRIINQKVNPTYQTRLLISNYLYDIGYIDKNGNVKNKISDDIEEKEEQLTISVDDTSKIVDNYEQQIRTEYKEPSIDYQQTTSNSPEVMINRMFEYLETHKDYEKVIEENRLLKEKIKRYEKILDKILG